MDIASKLEHLSGSELKAIIAIYTEGRYINTNDMMAITGMSKPTCLAVMKSEHVQKAVQYVQNQKDDDRKELINEIRKVLYRNNAK